MPKLSNKQRLLRECEEALLLAALLQSSESESSSSFSRSSYSSFNSTSDDDSFDSKSDSLSDSDSDNLSDSEEFLQDVLCRTCYAKYPEFTNYFHALPPDDFRHVNRVFSESFHQIVNAIQDHPVQNSSRNPQAPVVLQLACTLDRLGHSGNGASIA
ncbi:hypothetical protein PsorP6_000631 [Peronosclerospora sorghi]|uniref:Uncharacterized protein n=1 Tax=Peronosclerospora sorghi TaxID=230839 RepID=A0ACC0WSJ1_9STRA|nr:hypothetical protein PsorP6_000631 [Peronosclerospora sorghi]